MAQATNPKIEELRARIKSDPKSRLFFPLAEELRKMGGLDEAEHALRAGLEQHPTYLSAWVSLGRVLRERGNSEGVIEVLTRALQLDPGNVVASRILADTYLEKGQKVEAIKKYKLVHALLPQDQEVDALIEKLDLELNPPAPPPPPQPVSAAAPAAEEEGEALLFAPEVLYPGAEAIRGEESLPAAPPPWSEEAIPSAEEAAPAALVGSGDTSGFDFEAQPHAGSSDEGSTSRPSQFDDTAPMGYDSHAYAIEQPAGMHVTASPDAAPDEASLIGPATDEASPWAEPPAPSRIVAEPSAGHSHGSSDDVTNTITMGDLYARQGLVKDAREIYSKVLERDPGNESIRAKLDDLQQSSPAAPRTTAAAAKAARLEAWLSRVKRGSEGV